MNTATTGLGGIKNAAVNSDDDSANSEHIHRPTTRKIKPENAAENLDLTKHK